MADRRPPIYGRYFYEKEAIVGDFQDNIHPSHYTGQNLDGFINVTSYPQQTNESNRQINTQHMRAGIGASYISRDYETGRDLGGFGNVISYPQQRIHSHQPINTQCIRGGIGASYRNYPSQDHTFAPNFDGFGSVIDPQQASEFRPQRSIHTQDVYGGIGASCINHYNQNNTSVCSFHQVNSLDYRPEPLFNIAPGNDHRVRENINSSKCNQAGAYISNRHPTTSSCTQSERNSHEANHSQQALLQEENNIHVKFENIPLSNTGQNSKREEPNETDATAVVERSKLRKRIRNMYENLTPLLLLKNLELFDKENWLKVSFVYSDGMKKYTAEMFCPVCFGKLTPQNRKEPGMLPQWDLAAIKRHLESVHNEYVILKEVKTETMVDAKKPDAEGNLLDDKGKTLGVSGKSLDHEEEINKQGEEEKLPNNMKEPSGNSSSDSSSPGLSSDSSSDSITDSSDQSDSESDTIDSQTRKRYRKKTNDVKESSSGLAAKGAGGRPKRTKTNVTSKKAVIKPKKIIEPRKQRVSARLKCNRKGITEEKGEKSKKRKKAIATKKK